MPREARFFAWAPRTSNIGTLNPMAPHAKAAHRQPPVPKLRSTTRWDRRPIHLRTRYETPQTTKGATPLAVHGSHGPSLVGRGVTKDRTPEAQIIISPLVDDSRTVEGGFELCAIGRPLAFSAIAERRCKRRNRPLGSPLDTSGLRRRRCALPESRVAAWRRRR